MGRTMYSTIDVKQLVSRPNIILVVKVLEKVVQEKPIPTQDHPDFVYQWDSYKCCVIETIREEKKSLMPDESKKETKTYKIANYHDC
jgi:hypothetical protein